MEDIRVLMKKERIQKGIEKGKKLRASAGNEVQETLCRSMVERWNKVDEVIAEKGNGFNLRGSNYPMSDVIEKKRSEVQFKEVDETSKKADSLKPLEHQVLLHWATGCSYKEIADIVGLSACRVAGIVKKDGFKVAYNELMVDAHKVSKESQGFLQYNSGSAARRLVYLMNNADSDHVKLRAVTEVLDRGGVPQIKRTETIGEHMVGINLDGYPDDYKALLMKKRLEELENSRVRRIDNARIDDDGFEMPEIVEGEVLEERLDYRDAELERKGE